MKKDMEDFDNVLMGFQEELSNENISTIESNGTFIPKEHNYLIEKAVIPYNENTELESVPRIFSQSDMISDFKTVRDNLIVLIEASRELLARIPIVMCTTKPSMITAIATMNNSINANGKMLIELHEKIMKMQKDSILVNQGINPDQPTINNNNMMVNTKDLNQIIEDLMLKKKVE